MSHAAIPSGDAASMKRPIRGRPNLCFLIGAGTGAAFYFLFPCLLLPMIFGKEAWISQVMADWIDLLTFMAFGSATLLLLDRWWLLRRQERGFRLVASSGGPETLLLPEDALEQRKRLRQLDPSDRDLIVVRLYNAALQRARANWSAQDAGEAVKTQAELLQGSQDAQYSMIRYMAWAIPSLGFIGTVLGIGSAMSSLNVAPPPPVAAAVLADDSTSAPSPPATAPATNSQPESTLKDAIGHLGTAFNTTFVALILSLVLMLLVHRVQADEDAFLVRATDLCMQDFVFRMHIPQQATP